ncbi:hypothetical protein A3B02_02730 [Candidatus Roizmanbacteria bacterium RIFCSPLOWO2_01_FULL_42_14]|uniref:Methyltransferase domain-containing protein n=1 Tax=Candidatus Roizmanbacteria bacterium RIFCSPLOWO2_01_FULL_42_14 TaxID=1802068 RepID=A0A1F7JAS5_9BACT|nr:MAG: hypothetical protein A3B02_02730 [Candidatus Roizmanbacteria bacterium RIFCSPLOWO2_01_FULL_42_14]
MPASQNASQVLYDTFAPYYQEYAQSRTAYLEGINHVILNTIAQFQRPPLHVLDIGSGDGARIQKLKERGRFGALTVIENSKNMADLCRSYTNMKTLEGDITNIELPPHSFDYITCLWNVLGHIDSKRSRHIALNKMALWLKPNGLVFVDVNNRYNYAQYGKNAFLNMIKDIVHLDDSSGDISFQMHMKSGVDIDARVHLFSPLEMDQSIRLSGLRVIHKYYVSYSSGKCVPSFLQGQLMYILGNHD